MMDHPSNGISISGHLKPAFLEEEYYVRRLFGDDEVTDGYISDLKGIVKFKQLIHFTPRVMQEIFKIQG